MPKRSAVHLLFALSGASGLIYEVVWVREFGLVFGNTVHSATVVTSVFMGGLGIGAWLGGRLADRRPADSLRNYALAELLIAAFGLAVAVLLPSLTGASAAMSSYAPTPEGWFALSLGSHVARALMAVALLAPGCLLMGATLTLLVRDLTAQASEAGARVGTLYAANTVGAALGAFGAALMLLPWLGVFQTQLVAVALNLGCGAGALGLAMAWVRAPEESLIPVPTEPTQWPPRVALALFMAGASAMAMEIAWFRFFSGALGPYPGVFAMVVAVVLVGLAAGSALAVQFVLPRGNPALWFTAAQVLVVISALWGFTLFDPEVLLRQQLAIAQSYLDADSTGRAWMLHRLNGMTIARMVLLPSIAMGAAFPLGNALAQDQASTVGSRAGELYLATTAGNVVGAATAGFLLLPGLGIQSTVGVVALTALLAGVVIATPSMAWFAVVLAGAASLFSFSRLPDEHVLWRTFPANRARDEGVLAIREGLEQIVVVTGEPEGPARLWTSGHPMTSTSPHAQRYMRLLAHAPLLAQPHPQRVLVIAFGVGNTAHAASLHPSVAELEIADLSRDILQLAPLFAHANHDVLSDPRTRVYVNDGRHHLRMRPAETYDLITLEPPPLAARGVSALYSREFYELARSRLAPNGALSQWLPAYQVPEQHVRALVRAFVDVFPHTVLLVGSGRELLLVGTLQPTGLDQAELEARLRDRALVGADLAAVGVPGATELCATFVSDAATLIAATARTQPLTDRIPILENAQLSHLQQTRLPSDLFNPGAHTSWCVGPADPTRDRIAVLLAATVASEAFLRFDTTGRDTTSSVSPPDLEDPTLATIAQSPGLTRMLRAPDALALRARELWDAGRQDEAWVHLDAAIAQAPTSNLLAELADSWRATAAQPADPGQDESP